MKDQIQQIKLLVAHDEMEEALKRLIQIAENTPFINDTLLLSNRYRKEKLRFINGTNENATEINRITAAVLALSDELLLFAEQPSNAPMSKVQRLQENKPESIIGLAIDKYLITDYIHAGGFGTVYKARHSHLGHTYAVKISHEIELGFDFLDEIISLGITGLQLLDHPSIIKTFDIGEVVLHGGKRIYIVMEYIEGGTMADLTKSGLGKGEIWRRVEIFRKVCLGIHYAHHLKYTNKLGFQVTGLMHGDIKPSNILMRNGTEPKIMDFMFVDMSKLVEIKVKLPADIGQFDQILTQAFGTTGYMPLEQRVHGYITERTDIYALGILLFEICCPVRFSECKFNTAAQIHAFLLGYNKYIPTFISHLIYKATQEQEQQRYASVLEMIQILEQNNKWYRKLF